MTGPYDDTVEYFNILVRANMLQSGFLLEDPQELAIPLEKLVKVGMGFSREEAAEVIDFTVSEDEKDSPSEKDDPTEDEEEAKNEDGEENAAAPDSEEVHESLDDYYASKGLNPDGTPKDEDQESNNNEEEQGEVEAAADIISDDL